MSMMPMGSLRLVQRWLSVSLRVCIANAVDTTWVLAKKTTGCWRMETNHWPPLGNGSLLLKNILPIFVSLPLSL